MVGYPKTPKPIIINEALEIARKYSSPESVNFINGVLDGVGKALSSR
jgi:N utilization substance protein B